MNCVSINQMTLLNQMQRLWFEHIYWTRLLIISILNCLNDQKVTQERLLQNPCDLGCLFGQFYGRGAQKIITDLLTEHLVIGAKLVNAYKENNCQKIEKLNTQWYENADEMARAFACLNPCFVEKDLRDMFYMHLNLTKNEVSLRLEGKYREDIINFNELQEKILTMANYFTCGIVNHMHPLFRCNTC